MPSQLKVGPPAVNLRVPSDVHYFPTGVLLQPGATYRFVADKSEWTDAGHPSTAAGNPDPLLAQQVFSGLLRCQEANWFALIGAVGGSDSQLFPIGLGCEWTFEPISEEDEAETPPELQLFANDAIGFYWSNVGLIGVTIERIS
jgi:hypothetical protein